MIVFCCTAYPTHNSSPIIVPGLYRCLRCASAPPPPAVPLDVNVGGRCNFKKAFFVGDVHEGLGGTAEELDEGEGRGHGKPLAQHDSVHGAG